ncbi:lipopolysaccharide biosynthesis protein [Patiriisocius sp. Uisw_017]|jgi:O-antigen/teichoic acid export membrane protein|uniref:lipopolysaccharide biosynthesis protein n=1 Tax=Patiriisocius sp. Uisw_017 TaxID=3230968 RepID=UPI0039EB071B
MKSLDKKLRKGLLWSVIQVFIKRIFDLLVKLVLVNLLFPEDFGLVGIATAITSIIYVISEFGFKAALIQRKNKLLEDLHYQSVFWWSVFWSSTIFILVYFIGTPIAARFYDEPLLLKIIPILTAPILIEAVTIVYRTKMLRSLNFKTLAIINSIAAIITGFIAIIIALKGGGVWALVFYILIPFVISLPFYIVLIRWKPKLQFSIVSLKQLFQFGFFTFITSLILIISSNIDYLFIGKLISTKALGIYSLAFMLTVLISTQVTSMIDRVMFPFYSKIQGNLGIIRNYYLKSLRYYSLVLFPIMLVLFVLCTPIIKLFFGYKWIDAKTPIRLLVIAVMINLITHGCTIVFRSIGKPKLEMFILSSILILVTIPSVYVGSFYGINGVAAATIVPAICNLTVSLYFLKRELNITIADILTKMKPSIIAFGTTFLVVTPLFLFTPLNLIFLLIITIIVYSIILYYFFKQSIKFYMNKFLFSNK